MTVPEAALSSPALRGMRHRKAGLATAVDAYSAYLSVLVDPVVVALCWVRAAQIASGRDEPLPTCRALRDRGVRDGQLRELGRWRRSGEFDAMQRACLDYAEQFFLSAGSVTDEQVAVVREHLSAEQTLGLTMALWLADASTRLSTFLETLGLAEEDP